MSLRMELTLKLMRSSWWSMREVRGQRGMRGGREWGRTRARKNSRTLVSRGNENVDLGREGRGAARTLA